MKKIPCPGKGEAAVAFAASQEPSLLAGRENADADAPLLPESPCLAISKRNSWKRKNWLTRADNAAVCQGGKNKIYEAKAANMAEKTPLQQQQQQQQKQKQTDWRLTCSRRWICFCWEIVLREREREKDGGALSPRGPVRPRSSSFHLNSNSSCTEPQSPDTFGCFHDRRQSRRPARRASAAFQLAPSNNVISIVDDTRPSNSKNSQYYLLLYILQGVSLMGV